MQCAETYREGVGGIEAMHERMLQTSKTHHYYAKHWKNGQKGQL